MDSIECAYMSEHPRPIVAENLMLLRTRKYDIRYDISVGMMWQHLRTFPNQFLIPFVFIHSVIDAQCEHTMQPKHIKYSASFYSKKALNKCKPKLNVNSIYNSITEKYRQWSLGVYPYMLTHAQQELGTHLCVEWRRGWYRSLTLKHTHTHTLINTCGYHYCSHMCVLEQSPTHLRGTHSMALS